MKRLTLLFLFCFAGLLFADDAPPAPSGGTGNSRRGSGNGGGGGERGGGGGERGGGGRAAFETMREQLREKFPSEYAEIEKLRESDPRSAMSKSMELARQAGIEIPSFGGSRGEGGNRGERGGRNGEASAARPDPIQIFFKALDAVEAEAVKTVKLTQQTEPEKALASYKEMAEKHEIKVPAELTVDYLRGVEILPRDVVRFTMAKVDAALAEQQPEAFARIRELRRTDPIAARDAYLELIRKSRIKIEMLKPTTQGLTVLTLPTSTTGATR